MTALNYQYSKNGINGQVFNSYPKAMEYVKKNGGGLSPIYTPITPDYEVYEFSGNHSRRPVY